MIQVNIEIHNFYLLIGEIMNIQIFNPSDDTSQISGFTIVVDVFRAFSVSYYIDNNNPEKYIISESIEHSMMLKDEFPASILIGERKGIKVDGFEYGNSPTEILGKDFSENTVIHTTTAGTKGLLLQPIENEVVVGSFVNSKALLDYIKLKEIEKVNIYCTARKRNNSGEEDYLFAEYFKQQLLGEKSEFDSIVPCLREGSGKKFSDPGFAPYSDFLYCLDISRFNSILRRKIVDEDTHQIELERLN